MAQRKEIFALTPKTGAEPKQSEESRLPSDCFHKIERNCLIFRELSVRYIVCSDRLGNLCETNDCESAGTPVIVGDESRGLVVMMVVDEDEWELHNPVMMHWNVDNSCDVAQAFHCRILEPKCFETTWVIREANWCSEVAACTFLEVDKIGLEIE
ncbi:hypothetical protein PV325_007070 [Microctonus aethiopoides]|nr:hypothetical protein PV325_007070 [Microctonus aethiopoides]